MKKQTTQEFVKQIQSIHPSLDFSKVEYVGDLVPVVVVCNKLNHGQFSKTPKTLKKGTGCSECTKDNLRSMYSFTQEEYLEKCNNKFGNKYDYSKVKYVNSSTKVIIHCKKHGDFSIIPLRFISKDAEGCPKCSKEIAAKSLTLTTEEFIIKANLVHDNKYDYSKTNYINSLNKLIVTCKTHGDFEVSPGNHLSGVNCVACAGSKKKTTNEFIQDAEEIHGKLYDYSKVVYENKSKQVNLICKDHGIFTQRPADHLYYKAGCPSCAGNKKLTTEEFIYKATSIHGDKYGYSKVEYQHNRHKVEIICKTHGSFFQQPIDHVYDQNGCPSCSHIISRGQLEVEEFIRSLGFEVQRNRKLENKTELDIYVEKLKLAIEYNGLFWHSEDKKGNNYHLLKLDTCKAEGIRLVQIFEDEWTSKKELVKDKLRAIFGKSTSRIYARKTSIVKLSSEQTKIFLNNTHIQGSGFSTNLNFGLVDADKNVVAIMTFAKLRFEKGGDSEYELIRFSSCINVVGGFSKLLKYFISNYLPTKIVSYSDKRWSVGGVYNKNGFTWSSKSNPGYFWCKNGVRHNRVGFQKHKLSYRLEKFEDTLSEAENCVANGYYKIFDCGMDKWILDLTSECERVDIG